jgi:hypothetical protein
MAVHETPCPKCDSAETHPFHGQWVCRACQYRWDVVVGDLIIGDEIRAWFDRATLCKPWHAFRVTAMPSAGSLAAAVATLTPRQAANRSRKVERAIATASEIEAILERHLRSEWVVPADGWPRRHSSEYDLSAKRTSGMLDRLLNHVEAYERAWDANGRDPRLLCESSWTTGGVDVARNLQAVLEGREVLQIARTLLAAPTEQGVP